jgi:hypothetical protein
MKVVSVAPLHGETVRIMNARGETTEYVRFDDDIWYQWMGESLEPVYSSCADCETAYQAWKKAQ